MRSKPVLAPQTRALTKPKSSITTISIDSDLELTIEKHIKSLRQRGLIKSHETTAWSVYDFTTETKLATINEDLALQSASMMKPLIALAFFHQVQNGKIKYGYKSKSLMKAMLQQSNNGATNSILKIIGGPAKASSILEKHYGGIFQQTELVEYIPAGGRTYRNRASAHDYSRFLYALWKSNLPYSQELQRLMSLPGRDRIVTSTRLPGTTHIMNKTGTTGLLVGDMGIVTPKDKQGRARPYTLIGIIESKAREGSFTRYVDNRSDVIRSVSELVYDFMKKRHGIR
jgi:beta-lactamase class A